MCPAYTGHQLIQFSWYRLGFFFFFQEEGDWKEMKIKGNEEALLEILFLCCGCCVERFKRAEGLSDPGPVLPHGPGLPGAWAGPRRGRGLRSVIHSHRLQRM